MIKENKMKKLISIFLTIILAFSCITNASAETSEITTQDKLEQLIAQGIPETFFENKEDSDISELYDMLAGKTFRFLGTEEIELSETTDNKSVSTYGIILESDMLLSISKVEIVHRDTATNKFIVDSVLVYVDYEWFDGKPIINKTDGISVNWDSSLFAFKQNSFSSKDYKKIFGSSSWLEWMSTNNPETLNQGGLGYSAVLASSVMGHGTITAQKGHASFILLPKSRIYSGSQRATSINVEYVHNKDLFNTINFSYNGLGVSVSLSGLKDSVAKSVNYYYAV